MAQTTLSPIRIAALALLAGILCSWPLWDVGARPFQFPLLPLFGSAEFASSVPGHWQALLLCALTAALVLRPQHRGFLVATVVYLLLLCLLDLNRLQPWVWLYLLVFVTAVQQRRETLLRLLLAAIYFWAGFHKLTPYFAEDNFAWFCESFSWSKPLGQYPSLGYSIALLEMSFAAGLLWVKTRRWFRYLVVGFHVVILVALSPWGHDWNAVVLPWNLAMAVLVWLAFSPQAEHQRHDEGDPWPVFSFKKLAALGPAGCTVFALAWLAPALNIWGLWPHPLSWQLYTNTQPEATFYAEKPMRFSHPDGGEIWPEWTKDEPQLLLDDWAMRDLRVPIFASERTFRQMGRYLCSQLARPDSTAALYILSVKPWDKSAEHDEKIPCSKIRH